MVSLSTQELHHLKISASRNGFISGTIKTQNDATNGHRNGQQIHYDAGKHEHQQCNGK